MILHSELPAINLKQLGELCANSPDGVIYNFAGIQRAIKEVGLQIKFTDCKIAYAVKQ